MVSKSDGASRCMGLLRPQTPRQLHRFVRAALALEVPRESVSEATCSPFSYLCHAYFERGDAVVWANRGGGKTMMGAVATLLDLVFKPGIRIRILGGSLEQSRKMYEHLSDFFERAAFADLLAGTPTQRRIALRNGSEVELLSQSHRSVRGTRVHRLRCDEVDEFDPEVWEAAQLVTRSGQCGDVAVRGSIEALSTMHRPFGLMHKLVHRDRAALFKWNVMDVMAGCPTTRLCEGCGLWKDCQGHARQSRGFIPVEDVLDQRQRSSDLAWSSEMMCRRPRVDANVYPQFTIERHVFHASMPEGLLVCGMDFGIRNPTVVLWAWVHGRGAEAAIDIIDEHAASGLTTDQHGQVIRNRSWGLPAWVGVDPAGGARNAQTNMSDMDVLRRMGLVVKARRSRVHEGVDQIRRRLDHGTLRVHSRCVKLIEALAQYHFDVDHPGSEIPVKDGPDHACDALRYLVMNVEAASDVVVRKW